MHTLYLMTVPPEEKWVAQRLISDLVKQLGIEGVTTAAILDRVTAVITGEGPQPIIKWEDKAELVAAVNAVLPSYENCKAVLAIDPTPEESHAFATILASGNEQDDDEQYELVDAAIARTAVVAMGLAGGINISAVAILSLFARAMGDEEGVFTGAEELIVDSLPLPQGWDKRDDI